MIFHSSPIFIARQHSLLC